MSLTNEQFHWEWNVTSRLLADPAFLAVINAVQEWRSGPHRLYPLYGVSIDLNDPNYEPIYLLDFDIREEAAEVGTLVYTTHHYSQFGTLDSERIWLAEDIIANPLPGPNTTSSTHRHWSPA